MVRCGGIGDVCRGKGQRGTNMCVRRAWGGRMKQKEKKGNED